MNLKKERILILIDNYVYTNQKNVRIPPFKKTIRELSTPAIGSQFFSPVHNFNIETLLIFYSSSIKNRII